MTRQNVNIDRNRVVNLMKQELNVHSWDRVDSAYLIGSMVDPNKEVDSESDVDVLFIWEDVDALVKNQNENPNGITGHKSSRKWDNPMIQTKLYGERPLDIVEVSPLDNFEVPSFAVRLPI